MDQLRKANAENREPGGSSMQLSLTSARQSDSTARNAATQSKTFENSDMELVVNIRRLKDENQTKDSEIKKLNLQLAKLELRPQIEALESKLRAAQELFEILLQQVPTVSATPRPATIATLQNEPPANQSLGSQVSLQQQRISQQSPVAQEIREALSRATYQPTPMPTISKHVAENQQAVRSQTSKSSVSGVSSRSQSSVVSIQRDLAVAQGTLEALKFQLKQALEHMTSSPEPTSPSSLLREDDICDLEQQIKDAKIAIGNIRQQLYDLFEIEDDEEHPEASSPTPDGLFVEMALPPPLPKGLNRDSQEKVIAAARAGDAITVEGLLRNGLEDMRTQVDARGKDGVTTALMVAAENGQLEVVRILVSQFNAKLEEKDSLLGWTALMFAAFMGHAAVCQFLLQSGANVNARNNKGHTALSLAGEGPLLLVSMEAKQRTMNILMQRGARA